MKVENNGKGRRVYEIVTDRIIRSLEQGVIPWQKPWNSSGNG